jgi:NADH-quinone oxidoreductase subunit N
VATGAASEIWALIIILVVSSVVGLFYYLRIIAAMYGPAEQQTAVTTASISAPTGAVLGVLTGLLLWFGIYPEPLLRIIRVVLPT